MNQHVRPECRSRGRVKELEEGYLLSHLWETWRVCGVCEQPDGSNVKEYGKDEMVGADENIWGKWKRVVLSWSHDVWRFVSTNAQSPNFIFGENKG